MYAIVALAGQQFKITNEQLLYTPKLSQKVGSLVTLDKVLLLDDQKGKVTIGTPHIPQTSVQVEIVQHLKGDKVIVFKKKKRKGYKKIKGHRQEHTQIRIKEIHFTIQKS